MNFSDLYIFTAAFGLPGNLFTIFVLLSSSKIRSKPVNIFIIHQSIIDTMVCIVTILVTRYNGVHYFSSDLGEIFLCTVWYTRSVMWACIQCSGYNLMFLTLERFWAVTKPFQYNQEKVLARLPYIFLFTWIIGFATIIPNSMFNRMVQGTCAPFYVLSEAWMLKVIGGYSLLAACIIPGGVMIAAYVLIWKSMRKSQRFQNQDTANVSTKLKQAQMNLLQTCVILVIMFFLCWINHIIRFILINGGYFMSLSRTYYPSTLFFIILNSCLNPFVYCVRYKEFQGQVAAIFGLRMWMEVDSSQMSITDSTKH